MTIAVAHNIHIVDDVLLFPGRLSSRFALPVFDKMHISDSAPPELLFVKPNFPEFRLENKWIGRIKAENFHQKKHLSTLCSALASICLLRILLER